MKNGQCLTCKLYLGYHVLTKSGCDDGYLMILAKTQFDNIKCFGWMLKKHDHVAVVLCGLAKINNYQYHKVVSVIIK
jgi:hypothetical protein